MAAGCAYCVICLLTANHNELGNLLSPFIGDHLGHCPLFRVDAVVEGSFFSICACINVAGFCSESSTHLEVGNGAVGILPGFGSGVEQLLKNALIHLQVPVK